MLPSAFPDNCKVGVRSQPVPRVSRSHSNRSDHQNLTINAHTLTFRAPLSLNGSKLTRSVTYKVFPVLERRAPPRTFQFPAIERLT
ncbi:MAG: hypothetical protein ACJAXA_001918 [Candidatus Aldehydirespiratoraceae bacterium]|jgi:hypothetical protein